MSVEQPTTALTLNTTINPITCIANGSFIATANGGWGAFSYTLTQPDASTVGPQNSGVFNNLTQIGNYTITVTDANGCTDVLSVTVADLSGLTAAITTQADADCNGAATGSVTVLASGSTGPYTYASDGVTFGTSGTFTGLAAGSYTITAQDGNNCTIDVPVTIAEPS